MVYVVTLPVLVDPGIIGGMTTLPALLDEELARQGVEESALDENDLQFAAAGIRSLVTRLKTRTAWESQSVRC